MPHTPHCSEATEPRTGIEKREPFRFLTRSDIDIVTQVQSPPTQTPTRVTMGLIMTRTMIVIRRVTQTHDCK